MAELRAAMLEAIRMQLPERMRSSVALTADVRLNDLSIDSMGVIGLLLAFEERFQLDFERLDRLDRPGTVGELMSLVEAVLPREATAQGGHHHDRLPHYRTE